MRATEIVTPAPAPTLAAVAQLRADLPAWLDDMKNTDKAVAWALTTFRGPGSAVSVVEFLREQQAALDLAHWLLDFASDLEDEVAERAD